MTLGGLHSAFILVYDQSWGPRRIRGTHPPFFFFLFLISYFRSPFFPSPDVKWCDINGEPLSFVGPTVPAALVSKDPSLANLAQLRFRHPDFCQAGSLHNHVDFWEDLIFSSGYICPQVDLLQIIREGVRVDNFFPHFKGNLKGKHYDSAVPPISVFPNSPCCHQFTDFNDTTVLAWVSQGVIKVHGKIGECSPPHLVLPLTVEPSKLRLCHDERFLNLWIRDLPFKLDHLPDLPRYVLPGHFQTTFDDKCGYQHPKIHQDSQEFFGCFWGGYYFSFCTLPFGWKASAYLYHNVGLVVTVPHDLWAYLFHSILMTDMWASYSYPAQRFASLVANSHKQQPLSCYPFSFQRDILSTLQRVLHSRPIPGFHLRFCIASLFSPTR